VAVAVLGALVLLALLLTFVVQEVQVPQLRLLGSKRTTQEAAAGVLMLAVRGVLAAGVRAAQATGLRALQALRTQEGALAVVRAAMVLVHLAVQA
jgi:uncharacterized integral membrane protein